MGKKGKNDGGSTTDPTMWMVTFSDLLMLLLTFFVMLLTMKSMDDKTLKSIFSIFEGGVGVTEFSNISTVKPVTETQSTINIEKGVVDVMQALHASLDALLALNEQREIESKDELEEMLGGKGSVDEGIDLETLEGFMDVSQDARGVVITLESRALFEQGKADIKEEMYPLLDSISKLIKVTTNDILVMGHTDDQPYRGRVFRSNWELSLYRALNVHRYFVQREVVPQERIFAGGYGDTQPRFSNATSEGRAKNRRVEIILKKTDK